jgi:Ni/Co efflux regulator RcnB
MIRTTICAALAAATLAFAAPGAAQAMPANPGLNTSSSALVQTVRWHHRHHYRRHHRHRVCWRVRETVRWHHGRRVVRTVRRCGWRY